LRCLPCFFIVVLALNRVADPKRAVKRARRLGAEGKLGRMFWGVQLKIQDSIHKAGG